MAFSWEIEKTKVFEPRIVKEAIERNFKEHMNPKCECGKELVLKKNSCAPSPDFSHGHPYAVFECENGHQAGRMRCELKLPSCSPPLIDKELGGVGGKV